MDSATFMTIIVKPILKNSLLKIITTIYARKKKVFQSELNFKSFQLVILVLHSILNNELNFIALYIRALEVNAMYLG